MTTDPTEGMFEDEITPATSVNNLWGDGDYGDWIEFCRQYEGSDFQMVFGRDYRTVLRDGKNRSFSQDMVKQLGRMVTIFALTRIDREWKASGKAPQRMRVRFSIELDNEPVGDAFGTPFQTTLGGTTLNEYGEPL